MSDRIIKLLGTEQTPNTDTAGRTIVPDLAGTGAKLVRALNVDASAQMLITHKNSAGDETFGTISLEFAQEMFIQKAPTDTLQHDATNGDCLLVSVAFTD